MEFISNDSIDIEELHALAVETFVDTFAPVNTQEDMDHYVQTSLSKERLLSELADPNSLWFIAKQDNEDVGYVKVNFKDAQTELKSANSMEIERIYVRKKFQGKGFGQVLLTKAIETAADTHVDFVWLGVWEKNFKAIAFYEKNNFIPFDTHAFKLGNDLQTDILMKYEL